MVPWLCQGALCPASAEAEWRREAEEARKVARARGIDQAAIDRAVEKARYGQ